MPILQQECPSLTLKGSPSKMNSISALNWPSGISSSYLLHGPRLGSWDGSDVTVCACVFRRGERILG